MVWFIDIDGNERSITGDENLSYYESKVIGASNTKFVLEADGMIFELTKEVYTELKEKYPR